MYSPVRVSCFDKHTSADVVNSLMGMRDVPTLVADQKQNKAASVFWFISQLKKLSPEIMLPTEQRRHVHVLHSIVSTTVNGIGKQDKTGNFLVFTSQLILALLIQMQNPQKAINQIHRFLGCALGKAAQLPTKSISASHLHNFQGIASS